MGAWTIDWKATTTRTNTSQLLAFQNKHQMNRTGQTNRANVSIEGQAAFEFNKRMQRINEEFRFRPEFVWSQRVRRWLDTSYNVRMLDRTGSTIYLLSAASYIPENIHVYRNNVVRLSNGLYLFMVTSSCEFLFLSFVRKQLTLFFSSIAFGKSDFHKRYKHAILNSYQVKTTGEMLPRPNMNDPPVNNPVKCPYFIDDVSSSFYSPRIWIFCQPALF